MRRGSSAVRRLEALKQYLQSKLKKIIFRLAIKPTLVFILLAACKQQPKNLPLPFINKPDFTPEWINISDSNYKHIHTIPPFSFTNQNGERVTEKTLDKKIYVADFIFTRCASICPTMTKNMAILQNKFKTDSEVLLVSYSVTPNMDSVPVLKKYAKKNGIIPNKWHLLTGDENQIYALAKRQYFAGEKIGYYQNINEFLHTENFLLIDKKRRIRGVYNGTLPIEMDRLADDISTLKKEDDN